MSDMHVTALAPWMGAKRGMADLIVRALGPHRVYWEFCCGSMAVLLAKPPCGMETVIDLHGDLINLALVVQDRHLGPKLYRRLRRVICSDVELDRAVARMEVYVPRGLISSHGMFFPKADIDRAFDYFVRSWMGMNGTAGTRYSTSTFCVRYTGNGGHAAKRWRSAVNSIPAWRRRLAEVTILQDDLFQHVGRIDDAVGTAIYCDPPYIDKTSPYLHDPDQLPGRWGWLRWHVRLARELRRFKKARVVLSYYDHPYVRRLYEDKGWSVLEVDCTKSIVNQGKRDGAGPVKAPELLLSNFPLERVGESSSTLFSE